MDSHFRSLHTLNTVRPADLPLLATLGIRNIGDLLAFQPIRIATYVRAAAEGLLRREEILPYLNVSAHDLPIGALLQGTVEVISGLGDSRTATLGALGIGSIADLASYAPFLEAEALLAAQTSDQRDPFAPDCVLPTCRKFTRNSKSFVSFFRQQELRNLSIRQGAGGTQRYGASRVAELFTFTDNEIRTVHLGYSVSFLQEWVYGGVHLGEPQGSVNLFMGQDTQVSILDWRRAMSSRRSEDSRVSERLSSTLFHQRAVDEVARATAEEHQFGATSVFGANAATAGSFVAAGAVVGGLGGGITGGLIGSIVPGVGTITGVLAGAAVGTIAGAAAGSLIVAGGTTLGFVETDARGARDVFASSGQTIQQHTIQNSSSLRSFWSNIISQSVQEEQQTIRTDRVTNHNRIHALNALYFEVLNEYRVTLQVVDHAPILFLPFKPFHFTEELLRRYWWVLRTAFADQALVLALDAHFLALLTDPSAADELAELPAFDDIETANIVVEVNLDGSVMRSIIEGLVGAALLPLGVQVFREIFEAVKREQIDVAVVTTDGTFTLTRDSSPNADPNFVGRYSTTRRIPVGEITGVRITNGNAEFVLGVGPLRVDLTELAFEEISARLTIRNRSSFSETLPSLGSLEAERVIRRSTLRVGSSRSATMAWDVATRLRDQFEGVDAERSELETELAAEELVAAKIANLLGFLNANKFGFTRFILQNTEVEQVTAVLEGVQLGGVPLSTLAGTTPLGFCGNHVVLPLRNRAGNVVRAARVESRKLVEHLTRFPEIDRRDRTAVDGYLEALTPLLEQFIADATDAARPDAPAPIGLSEAEQFAVVVADVLALPQPAAGDPADVRDRANRPFIRNVARMDILRKVLLRRLQAPATDADAELARVRGYFAEIEAMLGGERGRIIGSDLVSLPSPAIFMEPVLSNAKGAELYDMRRNSHYEIRSAPSIGSADPNVIRSQQEDLTPNLPGSVLTVQPGLNLPLPNSLNAALAEAGKLDLSGLISSNGELLTTTVSELSSLATELAKASATLTGDAQAKVLETAGEVAKQLNEIVANSLGAQAPKAAASAPAVTAAPPRTQQEKAEVVRELDRIGTGGGTAEQMAERKRTLGVSVTSQPGATRREYQMSILFVDANGVPYSTGSFTLSASFFELGRTFAINGGAPIPMQDGEFLFPDTFSLLSGRRATISLAADIAGATIVGLVNFPLPDRTDITLTCRMLAETRRVSATSVRSAVDEVIRTSTFAGSLSGILDGFLTAGIAFPFRIAAIDASTGGSTTLDLRAAYATGTTSATSGGTGTTTVAEFDVTIPRTGWAIEVN